MRYAQIKAGNKLHLVHEIDGRLSQPLCGIITDGYRMNINLPLGHACKNCLSVCQARLRKLKPSDTEQVNGNVGGS